MINSWRELNFYILFCQPQKTPPFGYGGVFYIIFSYETSKAAPLYAA